jgi:CheY-like chemotaxis protein
MPSIALTTPAVLVADPCPMVRRLLELALRREGLRVLAAGCGREAAKLLRRHGPAVRAVLIDADSPGLAEAVQALRQAAATACPCLMSASRPEAWPALPGDGAGCVLPKPFNLDTLRGVVRELTGLPTPTP